MNSPNPIANVNLALHESWICLSIHRESGSRYYSFAKQVEPYNKTTRIERMISIVTEIADRAYHQMDIEKVVEY